jgi:aminoglycoside phosphotransferase family enzyme
MSPRKGTIVDWLVHMKRILEENMLGYAITHNTVDETLVKKVATLLSDFYVSSPGIA